MHQRTATPVGFEPTRGDPIGLAGRRLNRSAKVSLLLQRGGWLEAFFPCLRRRQARLARRVAQRQRVTRLQRRRWAQGSLQPAPTRPRQGLSPHCPLPRSGASCPGPLGSVCAPRDDLLNSGGAQAGKEGQMDLLATQARRELGSTLLGSRHLWDSNPRGETPSA